MKRKSIILLVFLLALYMFCSCENKEKTNQKKENVDSESIGIDTLSENIITLEDTNSVSENEAKLSAIIVDENGYDKDSKKIVYFSQKPFVKQKEKNTFRVVSVDQREIVYEGTMISDKKGDFSYIRTPGYYYIDVPFLGRSKTFYIGEGIMSKSERELYDLFTNLVDDKINQNKNGLIEGKTEFQNQAESLLWFIRYCEKNKDASNGKNIAKDLADSMNETAERYLEAPKENYRILSVYATSLVELSTVIYEKPDEELNTEVESASNKDDGNNGLADAYLNEAIRIFDAIYNDEEVKEEIDAYLYMLTANLYKTTGNEIYREETEKYIKSLQKVQLFYRDDSEEKLLEDECILNGSLAYLNTTYDVDTDYCEKLMDILDSQAQKYVMDSKRTIGGNISIDERSRLLTDRLFLVSVIERVIISQDYLDVLSQGVHYLNGCNEKQKNYITKLGIYNEDMDEPGYEMSMTGAYLYLVYELNHAEFEKGN